MNHITHTAYAYLAYLTLAIGITIWVARTLRRYAVVFLAGKDSDRPYADALSHLLIVGFYLVNFGVVSFVMRSRENVHDLQTGIELLSTKMGTILLFIGVMHFLLLIIFSTIKKVLEEQQTLDALGTELEKLNH